MIPGTFLKTQLSLTHRPETLRFMALPHPGRCPVFPCPANACGWHTSSLPLATPVAAALDIRNYRVLLAPRGSRGAAHTTRGWPRLPIEEEIGLRTGRPSSRDWGARPYSDSTTGVQVRENECSARKAGGGQSWWEAKLFLCHHACSAHCQPEIGRRVGVTFRAQKLGADPGLDSRRIDKGEIHSGTAR